LEERSQQMFGMGDAMLTRGRVIEPQEAMEKLSKVDVRAVREVAREIFQPGRLSVSATGPQMDGEQLFRLAGPLGKL